MGRVGITLTVLLAISSCSKSRETHPTGGTAPAPSLPVETTFWQWFVAHKDQVATIKRADEPIANQLAEELHRINTNLTFEMSVGEGNHEFIISADGIQSAFPAVKHLVAAAPTIPGWTVIAFRQRKSGLSIELGDGTKVGHETLMFQVLGSNGRKIDIAIYVKGAASVSDSAKKAVYLLLDATLGEYDVETRLGAIEIEPATKAPKTARPFAELAKVVDANK